MVEGGSTNPRLMPDRRKRVAERASWKVQRGIRNDFR
jgi:hypothetical protein